MNKMLSKSTFMHGCQCPKRLFLHKFKSKEADPYDEQAMQVFQRGTDTGVLAQQYFPGGVDAQSTDPYPGFESAKRTAAHIQSGEEVIYEATFIHDDTLVAVDILVKTSEGYDVYEVKSTNGAKSQHVQDGAVQYYVLKGAGLDVRKFYILHFDPRYVLRGELDIQGLFKATDITEGVLENQKWVADNLTEFHGLLAWGQEPDIAMGKQCDKPYPCNFKGYCSRLNPPEPEEEVVLDTTIDLNQDKLNSFQSKLSYPLYFFDFETVMFGVPVYQESSPYQQIPFQYSLHVLEHPEAEMRHYEFLAEPGIEPRENLIHALKSHIGATGSILVWYQSFEEGRLRELARDFPQHADFLEQIIQRLDDLIIPFKQGWVSSEAFGGSSSIKNVLPVMVPELSYQELTIQEGGTASFVFSQLAFMPKALQEQTRADLLAYCRLDTLAMVKIWEKISSSDKFSIKG